VSHSHDVEGTSWVDTIKEELVAERIAIDSSTPKSSATSRIGDPTSRRVMEEVLAKEKKEKKREKEEEHAEEIKRLIDPVSRAEKPNEPSKTNPHGDQPSQLLRITRSTGGVFEPA
jgi:bacterioferritin